MEHEVGTRVRPPQAEECQDCQQPPEDSGGKERHSLSAWREPSLHVSHSRPLHARISFC